jgi:hypothetical protein
MASVTKTGIIQSITPIGNGQYRILLEEGSFFITQNNPGTGNFTFGTVNTSSLLLNPYTNTPNITYSDYNATLGNATDIRPGTIYQDIDYSSNTVTPVNFNQLISGSATKANIPDSNYSTKRITKPRYEGSRSTSNDFNLNSNEGGLGTLPNVEQDRAYFVYFNWVGGTSPEWGNGLQDRSGLSIRYFIDSEGNVIEPTNDSNGVNLSITRQTFTEGEVGVLSFNDDSGTSANFSNLVGEQTIFKSGKTIAPIIYTQTASISSTSQGGYTGSIEFGQGDLAQSGSSIGDFNLYANPSSIFAISPGNNATFASVISTGSDISFPSPYSVSTNTGDPSSDSITLNITFQLYGSSQNRTGTFEIYKDGSGTGITGQIDGSLPYSSQRQTSLSYTDSSSTTGTTYQLKLNSTSDNAGFFLETTSYFRITQQPLPTIGDCQRFWEMGSSNNQIKALGVGTGNEGGLKQFYGQKQKDIEDSGFFPITLDFTVEPGDEIRFQGTETQAYKVIEVDTTGGDIILTLDRNVTATNLDWFLLRRYIDAPGTILIEADKPAGGTSPGFFMPLYATKGIEDNFDKVIQQLKTDQLI